jgi:hypothetical protein
MSTVIVTQVETGTAVFACKFIGQRRHVHLRVKLERRRRPHFKKRPERQKNEPPGQGRAASHFSDLEAKAVSG